MKLTIFIVLFLLFLGGSLILIRKEMPYDFRMINLNGDLMIHNKTIWNQRPLNIQYQSKNGKKTAILSGATNTAVIKGVKAREKVSIKIARQDLVGKLRYKPFISAMTVPDQVKRYIIIVGASIGKDWKLEQLPQRKQELKETAFLYWPEYRFDKKAILDHVLKIPIKPTMLLLKECAAYFPRNEKESVETIRNWFLNIEKQGIRPIILTTLPVTPENDKANAGRENSISTYNDALRESGLALIDTARELTDNEDSPYLAKQYAQKDGLHLNKLAYDKLDTLLAEFPTR